MTVGWKLAAALDEEIARTEDARDWAVKFEQESAARGMAIAEALAYLDEMVCECVLIGGVEHRCAACHVAAILECAP